MDEIERREEEEEEFTVDPEREAYYKDDPKKALKKYFDREGTYTLSVCISMLVMFGGVWSIQKVLLSGVEFEYDVEEEGSGRDKTYIVRVT